MVLKAEDITLTGASFTGCCRNKPGACPAGANKFGVTNVNFNGEDITAVASQVFGTDSEGNVMVRPSSFTLAPSLAVAPFLPALSDCQPMRCG